MYDKNKAGLHCLKCDSYIFSEHRHECVFCKCGACYVDGGNDYLRYGGKVEDFELVDQNHTVIITLAALPQPIEPIKPLQTITITINAELTTDLQELLSSLYGIKKCNILWELS